MFKLEVIVLQEMRCKEKKRKEEQRWLVKVIFRPKETVVIGR